MDRPDLAITPTTSTECQRAHVLLVEDDPKLQELLRTVLQVDNICLSTVCTAQEALTLVAQTRFDMVILDLGLPEQDGFTVLKGMQQSQEGACPLPVFVLTSWHRTEDKVKAFELGAVDYVTKPFEVGELRARVRATLRTKRLQDQLTAANHKLNEARLAAEEAARAKADFLASMSHEIRTPMNGVIAMTGLLLETELQPEQQEFVETIRTSGESLLTIINDILNISKIQAGKLELEKHPLSLRLCIEEAFDILATKAAEKHLDLLYEVDDQVPAQVIGDITRLRQVLVNLVGNAIKFTSQGEVGVHVKCQPLPATGGNTTDCKSGVSNNPRWEIQFAVRDTGIGIPPDRLHRLFRSFSQVDSSTTRHYGGTGLGLAISKGLVELMGGKIWVESTEGRGSVFFFNLPLEAASGASVPESLKPHPRLTGLKLLIVEDNANACRILARDAQRWGVKTEEACSTQQAIEQFTRSGPFDCVLLDMQLPGMEPASFVQQLRCLPGGQTLQILGLSSVGNGTESCGSPIAGIAGCINKPVKGMLFRSLLLQVRAGKEKVAPRPSVPASKLDTSLGQRIPLRVLLADDNVINQKVASRLLQQLGYKVDVANNGQEAIQALERQPYDLIFMDVQMPVLDGLEATRRIRRMQQDPSGGPHFKQPIFIVAMTANAMQGDKEKCLAAGMNNYLPKPIRPEALQAAIEEVGALSAKPGINTLSEAANCAVVGPVPASEGASATAGSATKTPEEQGKIVDAPVVDMERLLEFSGGNQENLNELISLYLKQTAEQLVAIRAALQEQEAVRVSRLAHSCAGASSTCGMLAIVPLLRKLEHMSAEGDLRGAPELVENLSLEFERIKTALADHQKTTATDQRKVI